MLPDERTSVRLRCLVLMAIAAATISCSATRLRGSHTINRSGGDYDNEVRGIHGLREGMSSRMWTKPTEQQWENLCKEANCEHYEWCRRTGDVILREIPSDPHEDPKVTPFWQATCNCEGCDRPIKGQPKYVYAVCASNGETFVNECWFRRCQCEANRLELTVAHQGKCKGPAPEGTKLGDDFCPGEPKAWDIKFDPE